MKDLTSLSDEELIEMLTVGEQSKETEKNIKAILKERKVEFEDRELIQTSNSFNPATAGGVVIFVLYVIYRIIRWNS